jgi:hypothetical protein
MFSVGKNIMKLAFMTKESGTISISDFGINPTYRTIRVYIYIYIYLPLSLLQLETKYRNTIMKIYSFMGCISTVLVPAV